MPQTPKQEVLPTLYGISEDMLPAIKNWKPGEKYRVEMTILQTALRKGDRMYASPSDDDKDESKKFSADFVITEIKAIGKQSTMEKIKRRYT